MPANSNFLRVRVAAAAIAVAGLCTPAWADRADNDAAVVQMALTKFPSDVPRWAKILGPAFEQLLAEGVTHDRCRSNKAYAELCTVLARKLNDELHLGFKDKDL